jgi:flagellar assembly protein FliH
MSMSYRRSDHTQPLEGIESFVYRDSYSARSGEASSPPPAVAAGVDDQKTEPVRSNDPQPAAVVAQARAEGLQEGRNQIRAALEVELAKERKLMAEAIAAFQAQNREYYSKVEAEVVHLALSVAARILHRESQVDPSLLLSVVKLTLEKLQEGSKVVVRVHPKEVGKWQDSLRERAGTEIRPDETLGPNDCRVETEMGSADLGLNAQLKEIERGFCDLLALRPEAK